MKNEHDSNIIYPYKLMCDLRLPKDKWHNSFLDNS